ncbi:hypothetical protein PIB30_114543, partial [Stylosanthes scabra]|nr:hypothetical protein [Stylosanthes scabra]MED6191267.1 hypothetical protein [Stylosanthes scabra]
RMNNNLAAVDGANAEDNAGVSKSRGWKLRKKFPRPPPSYRSSTQSTARNPQEDMAQNDNVYQG